MALKRGTATAEAILKRYNSYNVTHQPTRPWLRWVRRRRAFFSATTLPSQETQHEVHEGLNVVEDCENWNATSSTVTLRRFSR